MEPGIIEIIVFSTASLKRLPKSMAVSTFITCFVKDAVFIASRNYIDFS